MPEETDNRIFTEFTQGNQLAFEKIFKANFQQIVGFCSQFINDEDEAQSLAQEAFVKLWLNRAKLEKTGGIKSFLYTAAKSGCLNYIRHKKVESKYQNKQLEIKEQQLNIEVLDSFGFESLEFIEIEKLLFQCIENLPEKSRMVFVKSRLEGMKNKEIAEEMNISIKSVESNMTRALKTIKVKLSDFLPFILIEIILNQHLR